MPGGEMSVTVVAPMLNEIRFVKAWFKNVEKYADEIIVCDTGSTDGSLEFIEKAGVRVYQWTVKERYRWPEAAIRQLLTSLARTDWICYQDLDELVGWDFILGISDLTRTRLPFVRFPQLHFWGDLHTIRVRSFKSWHDFKHFYPNGTKTKLYRMGCTWKGGAKENGCNPWIEYKDWGILSQRICRYSKIPFYHFNHAFPPKENNMEWLTMDGKFKTYNGPLPEEVRLFL
jgi:glycosyltransferase involved in cell wall biosynthesis